MKPLIGITQSLDDRGRWRAERDYLYIDRAYSLAVERAGGVALHLPIQADPGDLGDLVARIDGLLLPGGDDLRPPTPYPPDIAFDLAPEPQIEFDTRLLDLALERELPILGICYGMQLLALRAGGTLHYHLPLDLPDARPHDDGRHQLRVEPGTRLADILGSSPTDVNSLHHQAVARPGPGLRISAYAEDGVVEAIESESEHFCVGLQWHPEKLGGDAGDAPFRALVEACQHGRQGDSRTRAISS